jgi:hypothetical protein
MRKGKWDHDSSDEEADVVADLPPKRAKMSPHAYVATSVATRDKDLEDFFKDDTATPSQESASGSAPIPARGVVSSSSMQSVAEAGMSEDQPSETSSVAGPTKEPTDTNTAKARFEHNPLTMGCRSVDEYKRLNFISQGTYGMVFRARCRTTGDIVALKQVKLGAEVRKGGFPVTALRETNILLALNHPNIMRVREMVVGSTMDKIYMVMDYYENDLKTCMDMKKLTFSIAEVKRLMLQLCAATEHIHDKWFIHRDLKTSNLLYSNTGSLAVCDFGLARKYGRYDIS